MATTLTTDVRDALRQSFREAFGDRLHRLILYGSHARGEATDESDIDLFVVLKGTVGSDDEERARRVGRDVFGVDWDPMSTMIASQEEFATRNLPLFRNVRAEGELLVPEDDPSAVHRLRTHSYSLHLTPSGMRKESEGYIDRAHARLETARASLNGPDPTATVSLAYYAMFLAATAALNEADLAAKSHGRTSTLFSKTYVKDGPLDAYYGSLLSKAQEKRLEADYARDPSITASDAEEWLHRAEDFVDTVESMLPDRAET